MYVANFFICSLRHLCVLNKKNNARLKRYDLQPYLGMRNDGEDGINSLEKLQQVHIHYFKTFNKCFVSQFVHVS
jgi:hypothetical protein